MIDMAAARLAALAGAVVEGLAHRVRGVSRAIGRARQRRALGDLDERLLRDIGRSREEARRESRKPPWR